MDSKKFLKAISIRQKARCDVICKIIANMKKLEEIENKKPYYYLCNIIARFKKGKATTLTDNQLFHALQLIEEE